MEDITATTYQMIVMSGSSKSPDTRVNFQLR